MNAVLGPDEEYVCCDLCGADEPVVLFNVRRLDDGRQGGIVRCGRCGLVYANIRLRADRERRQYETFDYSNLTPDWIAARRRAVSEYMAELDRFRRLNRVLDVGAGHGFFLEACRAAEWGTLGVELSAQAVAFARERLGVEIRCESFEETVCEPGSFDVVTFWNVLDQLRSPRAALRKAHSVLRPGGAVLARFPNAAFHVPVHRALLALSRVHRGFKKIDQTIFHLFEFDAATATRLFIESGFDDILIRDASLVWTTDPDKAIPVWKRAACALESGISWMVRALSAGRAHAAPSILAVGVKPRREAP